MEIDFGPYKETPHTVRRPPQETFAPAYRLDQQIFDALRRIERADERVRHGSLDAATTQRLVRDARSRNAYGTASIEGNPLSLEDVQSLLDAAPTPDFIDTPDEREILNHARFLDRLADWPLPKDPQEVAHLHATLFKGVLRDAGEFKQRPNFIGKRPEWEVTFVPAMPERVIPELQDALAWAKSADEHPIIRALVFFHEFQSIHPFRDGNGRTGRAILHLHLHHLGYTGIRFAFVDYLFNEDRDGYYGALQQSDAGDFTPWLRYGSTLLAEAFEDARRRIALYHALADTYLDRQVHIAEWFARIARGHDGRRVKFADVHAAFPQTAERTLKRDLKKLVEGEVIVMEGTGKATTYHYNMKAT